MPVPTHTYKCCFCDFCGVSVVAVEEHENTCHARELADLLQREAEDEALETYMLDFDLSEEPEWTCEADYSELDVRDFELLYDENVRKPQELDEFTTLEHVKGVIKNTYRRLSACKPSGAFVVKFVVEGLEFRSSLTKGVTLPLTTPNIAKMIHDAFAYRFNTTMYKKAPPRCAIRSLCIRPLIKKEG